jgi:uridine phosphorylase
MTMPETSELVVVSTFRSVPEAVIAQGILDEVGIESIVRSDNAGGMYPALAGADLLVRADDIERANDALHRRHQR